MLRLCTFGGCFLERDGTRLDALSGHRKSLALLALLAASGPAGMSRDVLAAFLWPESDEERARTSLRQLVHSLRSQLASPGLLVGSSELRLGPDGIASDVGQFRDAVARGDHSAVAALHVGPFLDGFYLKDANAFERWAATERATLARQAAHAYESLAQQAAGRGDDREAVAWWRRLANAEPLSAKAAMGLMRALDAAGERPAALQHARVYEALVREELGAAPDPQVTELAKRLRAEPSAAAGPPTSRSDGGSAAGSASPVPLEPAAQPAPRDRPGDVTSTARRASASRATRLVAAASIIVLAAVAAPALWRQQTAADGSANGIAPHAPSERPPASVAVMPFVNTSGDAATEPLSDGFTDELIGALGKVRGLKVVGRTSAFALKGKGLTARAVGDTLDVGTVLEASVRRSGDRIKVTAQLVSTSDNSVIWSETYDRTLIDVFSAQEEIAQAIVSALRVQLVDSSGGPLIGRATSDATAYDLYLRGRHIFYTRPDRDGALQAARYFQQAAARDPTFARAHAGLSDVHTRLAVFGFGKPDEEFALAKAAARRALALDSTVAEAHSALGHASCVADFDFRAAERAFRRAVALDPGYTFARLPFAICLTGEARFAEAIAQLDTARSLDPLAPGPGNALGRVYVVAGYPERAIEPLTAALELNPQMDLAFQQLGHAYLRLGRNAEAITAFQRAAALSGVRDSAQLAYAYAITGNQVEAKRIVASLVQSATRRHVPSYYMAQAYAGLGDPDAAFEWLERAREESASLLLLRVDPGFESLRQDPRWAPLLREVGLDF